MTDVYEEAGNATVFLTNLLILLQYDLVCDDSVMLSVAQSCYWVGMLIALLVGGFLSDKFGRRIVWYGSCALVAIATCIMIFPKAFVVFIVCRVFIGVGSGKYLYLHKPGVFKKMLHDSTVNCKSVKQVESHVVKYLFKNA